MSDCYRPAHEAGDFLRCGCAQRARAQQQADALAAMLMNPVQRSAYSAAEAALDAAMDSLLNQGSNKSPALCEAWIVAADGSLILCTDKINRAGVCSNESNHATIGG